MTKKAPTKPHRMTSKDLTFATTDDARSLQYQADVVIDVRNGWIAKNRFGPCGLQPIEASPQGGLVSSYLEAAGYAFGKPPSKPPGKLPTI
jgi:hypothetical protein